MASRSSSSSDSEGSSSEDQPKVTTKTERQIRKYQIKRSLILERIFAIEQVNGKSLSTFQTQVQIEYSMSLALSGQ